MAESVAGTIDHVIYHNPENGFSVLKVMLAPNSREASVVGKMIAPRAGEHFQAEGDWHNDREHGLQFQATQIQTGPPASSAGIEKFLASGLIKGIGPHYAHRIVEVFGDRTLAVIDESPAFLREIKGIGARRIEQIRKSWQEHKGARKLMLFLHEHGLGTARALRIHRRYGDQAVELIRTNPYRLADEVWGIGFRTADALAQSLKIDPQSPLRARAALLFALKEQAAQGHVGCPRDLILAQVAELTAIETATLEAAADEEIRQGTIVCDAEWGEPWLYRKELFVAEVGAAQALVRLAVGRHPLPAIALERALAWVEKQIGLGLAQSQRDAISKIATEKVVVITGGPGVGKTTIVNGVLRIFAAKGLKCVLCAPTGRAAKRLEEVTGHEAKTIHRLLEYKPATEGFSYGPDDPIAADLVIVDEVSMIDIPLLNHLVNSLPRRACLLLVGDADQLPSVGPGNALADIIHSGVFKVAHLTEIFRQAEQSWIVRAAHRVNQGQLPQSAPPGQGDFYFIEVEDPDQIIARVLQLVQERIPARFGFDPVTDIQILTPMNRSPLGSRALNTHLRSRLNPRPQATIERFGWTFGTGDKVIQTVNNYDKMVFNGDVGRIVAIDPAAEEVQVNFGGQQTTYQFGELDELALAYALTIHKSQGSEYPAVVIPLHTQHYMMLQRNLLYTGITRGKKLTVLVGSRKALALAVERHHVKHRFSRLKDRLQRSRPPASERPD